jgi:hypothetical protein
MLTRFEFRVLGSAFAKKNLIKLFLREGLKRLPSRQKKLIEKGIIIFDGRVIAESPTCKGTPNNH